MSKVYNTIGSLTAIRTHLTQNKIDDFNSLGELTSFQENYATARQQIISNSKILVTEERNNLSSEVLRLEDEISKSKLDIELKLKTEIELLIQKHNHLVDMEKSFIQEFLYSLKVAFLDVKIRYKEFTFNKTVSSFLRPKAEMLAYKKNRLQYLMANFDETVKERSRLSFFELDRRKKAIDEINTSIYGAIGEQKVVNELEKLSDEYTLINDFSISFPKPIYYRQARQYIRTIQIDHLLISTSGIFLIETKNWSKDSLNNLSLRSPVDQIKRTNFALYRILSDNQGINLDKHHWGDRKIPIRNLIVMINHKPTVEFEHVKVLTLNELLGYVEFFKPSLSDNETRKIVQYLLNSVSGIR